MESKKDIGKFFRENLGQLDQTPSARVWEGIETDLNKKKKKRLPFFWFFLTAFTCGSIATLILLNFNNSADLDRDRKNTNTISAETSDGSKNTINSNTNSNTNPGSTDNSDAGSNLTPIENNAVSTSKNYKNSVSSTGNSSKKSNTSARTSAVAASSKNNNTAFWRATPKKSRGRNKNLPGGIPFENQKNTTSASKPENSVLSGDNPPTDFQNTSEKTNPDIADNDKKKGVGITEKNPETKTDSLANIENCVTEKKRKLPVKDKDSTAEQPNEEERGVIIAPYYGYSFSGKLGSGNSISSQYATLEEGGTIHQNYGILLRWMGTEKIGIQTGIGILQANRFLGVEKNSSFFSPNNNLDLELPMSSYETMLSNDSKVKFYQEYKYIEVPLEVYYIWSENKFGLAGSFGLSLFFLNKNDIYLESDSVEKFRIGSSKNAARQSFVANAKVNLFYKLSKRFQVDVYPEFQFHIMSHKDASGFHPYYLSLKAGISYRL